MSGIYDADKVSALRVLEVGETIITAQSEKVPFTRLVPRGSAPKQFLATYPNEVLPRRSFQGTADGTDQTGFSKTNRLAIQANAMWLRTDGVMASKKAQLTATAGVGVKKEFARQKMRDGVILSQMIERQLLSTMDIVLEAGATPDQSRGLLAWLIASLQSTLPVNAQLMPSSAMVHTGTLAALTPAVFEGLLRAMALQKMGPVDLQNFCGIALKSKMSKWTQHDTDVTGETAIQRYNLNASEKKFMQLCDTFEFDAGTVTNILSMFLACEPTTGENTDYSTRSGAIVDLDMFELCWLQAPQWYDLPDLGGGPRGMHDAVFMLKGLNMMGQGAIYTQSDS
jgi:hypothetical protein